jgi:signal transduction histidine kinase
VVAEFRALRASALRLWRESGSVPDVFDLDDVTRFNESIDESLASAIHSFAEQVDSDRATLLAKEQAARRDAEAADRAKDLFLATLSHQMRRPLNAVVGWVNIRALGLLEQQQTIDETSVNTSDSKGDLRTGATLVPHDGSDGDPVDELSDAEAIFDGS